MNLRENIRRWAFSVVALVVMTFVGGEARAQFSSVAVNAIGLATGNINAAIDVKLDTKISLNMPLSFSPVMSRKVGWQNVVFAPGARFWTNELYNGSFIGVYGSAAYYRLRYDGWNRQGWAAGVGVSYGYSHLLTKRWNLEIEVGVSAIYADFDKTRNYEYGIFEDEYWWRKRQVRIVPSKLKVSFGYLF